MFAQPGGLFVAKQHLAWLDDIEVGEFKDPRIHQVHRVRRVPIGIDSRQPLDTPDKLAVGGRVVGAPAPSQASLPALQIRTLEIPQRRVAKRDWAPSFRRAHTGIDHSRVVILRFCFRRGIIGPSAGPHDYSKEQHKKRFLHDVRVQVVRAALILREENQAGYREDRLPAAHANRL